jgi:hypothetical protein
MNRRNVKGTLGISLQNNSILDPLRSQMLVDLVELVEPSDHARNEEDQPSRIGVISDLSQKRGGWEQGGKDSREIGAGVNGDIRRVGGEEGGQRVVDGDRMDWVSRSEDITQADVVCDRQIKR